MEKLYAPSEIGKMLGRGRSTPILLAERLEISPAVVLAGGRRLFSEEQKNELVKAFDEKNLFRPSGRKRLEPVI